MTEWIDREILEPSNNQRVMIRIYNNRLKKDVEIEAVFKETEDYKSWKIAINPDENPMDITAKPTHWKEINES